MSNLPDDRGRSVQFSTNGSADDGPAVWFITGGSSGFGAATVRAALACGYRVAATARDSRVLRTMDDISNERLLALDLDLRDNASIATAVERTYDAYGRIDVLFNNAGSATVGAVEESPTTCCAINWKSTSSGRWPSCGRYCRGCVSGDADESCTAPPRPPSSGGLHADAARLYLDKLDDIPAAARAFEAGGELRPALELYRRTGDHAAAGDVLRKLGEPEEAKREYLAAAEGLATGRADHLAAAELLLDRGVGRTPPWSTCHGLEPAARQRPALARRLARLYAGGKRSLLS